MAIDRTGISSLETGAPEIKLTGNQDPREPNQKFAGGGKRGWMAQERAMEIAEDEYGRDFYDLNDSLQHKIYIRALQEIDDMLMGQAQGREGIQMASAADPMLEEQYQQYVFEMKEQGLTPMSFEEFRQQAVAGMATGGIANTKTIKGQPHMLAYITPNEAGTLKDLGGQETMTKEGIPAYPEWDYYGVDKTDFEKGDFTKSTDKTVRDLATGKTGVTHDDLKKIIAQEKEVLNKKYEPPDTLSPLLKLGLKFFEKPLSKGSKRNRKFFIDKVLGSKNYNYSDIRDLLSEDEKSLEDMYQDYMRGRTSGEIDAYGNPLGGGGDGPQPIIYPYQTASVPGTDTPVDETEIAKWTAPHIPTWEDEKLTLYSADGGRVPAADGGRIGYAGGGIADLRQGYFLGKLVKKAGRALKKVVKSPIGKAALLGLGGYYLGGGQLLGGSRMFGDKFGTKFALDNLMKRKGIQELFTKKGKGTEWDPWKLGIGAASLYPLIAGMGDEDDKDFTETDLYKKWLAEKQGWDTQFAGVGDPANFQRIRFAADGGRIGYKDAGDVMMASAPDPMDEAFQMYKDAVKNGLFNGTFDDFLEKIDEMRDSDKTSAVPQGIMMAAQGGRIGYAYGSADTAGVASKVSPETQNQIEKSQMAQEAISRIMEDFRKRFPEKNDDEIQSLAEAKFESLMDSLMNENIGIIGLKEASDLITPESVGKSVQGIALHRDDDIGGKSWARGGRIGYAGGYMVDDDEEELPHRTAALKAMYGLRRGAQEGGLMDLGGMEKDYRNEGGFVPIGGQERADDVPARLSKNEFVFTADAVRNAGGGDIDKGAEIMENLMENLEQGGKVSEESQGLEGARNMFATSQRLEGVL